MRWYWSIHISSAAAAAYMAPCGIVCTWRITPASLCTSSKPLQRSSSSPQRREQRSTRDPSSLSRIQVGCKADKCACMQALQSDVAAELRTAHQENLGIYMQRVPGPEALPRIDSKQMAQPKSPEAELLKRSEEWFRDIVPDKVTRNLSRCAAAAALRRMSCSPCGCVRLEQQTLLLAACPGKRASRHNTRLLLHMSRADHSQSADKKRVARRMQVHVADGGRRARLHDQARDCDRRHAHGSHCAWPTRRARRHEPGLPARAARGGQGGADGRFCAAGPCGAAAVNDRHAARATRAGAPHSSCVVLL